MRWFGSRVNWDTLTGITQELFGFITSEQDSGGAWEGARRYTVRAYSREFGILPLSEFGEFETLKQAKFYLANNGFENNPIVISARETAQKESVKNV
jgi:hypothetical protein